MVDFTRRQFLQLGAAAGLGLAGSGIAPHVLEALAAPPKCGRLTDIEHVVILIQENRSFDHYFGCYPFVTGFGDRKPLKQRDGTSVFQQPGYPAGQNPAGRLLPFHLDTASTNAACTNDITHNWGPQHRFWNKGRMDRFVSEHLAQDPVNGPLTMGYYNRGDLPFLYALADAFTLCDRYFCSVIGPTDPNRLYSMSGTLDPDGKHGGPLVETLVGDRAQHFGSFTWTTMPEQLEARGISWKVYSSPDNDSQVGDTVLPLFKQYLTNPTLAAKGLVPTYPGTFQADVAAGGLPQVSWVITPFVETEHPPAPPTYGAVATHDVLATLTSDTQLWQKCALFVTYDENGGFFDHVPPPVPPAQTPGEYLTVSPLPAAAEGTAGPIGLGFRVPMLVVSPFSRGGFVSSQVFDHTSTLLFLERRFGAEVPNLSAWRRATVGDLTSAFNFAYPDASVPILPAPSLADPTVLRECPPTVLSMTGEADVVLPPYPVPSRNQMPTQEPGTRRRPSGLRCG